MDINALIGTSVARRGDAFCVVMGHDPTGDIAGRHFYINDVTEGSRFMRIALAT